MRFRESLILTAVLGAGCQEYNLSFSGRYAGAGEAPALETPRSTDVVRNTLSAQVDVLWVLDNSGSMGEEQDKLATNLGAFYDFLDGSGLDWHIGVITTDGDSDRDSGKLLRAGGYAFLTQDNPYSRELFEMLVRVGTGGSADEKGLYTTYRALTQDTRELQQANRGFLRANAGLHVIVISDEDDVSDNVDASELANYLVSLKASPDIPVTFNSIVGPAPNGCDNADTSAVYGSRYVATTNRVGGIFESICAEDWVPVLSELGLQAAGKRTEYFLSEVPVPGTVEVVVRGGTGKWDGVEVANRGQVEASCEAAGLTECFGFRFDRTRNSISMLDFVPPEGARVRITYELLSGLIQTDQLEAEGG